MTQETKKLLPVKNVEVAVRSGYKVALACVLDDARYHIWLFPHTMDIGDELYKNPSRKASRFGDKDYFPTRILDVESERSTLLIESMLAVYKENNLLMKFKAKETSVEAKRKVKQEVAKRISRARHAGPELLKALKEIERIAVEKEKSAPIRGEGLSNKGILEIAQKAISKAEKGKE